MRLVAVFHNLGTVDVESIPIDCKIYTTGRETPPDSLIFQEGAWIPNLSWRGSERDSIIEKVVDFGSFKVPPSTITPSAGMHMRIEFCVSEIWQDDNPYNDRIIVYVNGYCRASKRKFSHTPSDSQNVRMVGRWSKGPCFSVVYKDGYLFTGAGKDLYVLDVSEPSKIVEINRIPTDGMIYGLSISENHLYVANGENGLLIFNIADPTNPQKKEHKEFSGQIWRAFGDDFYDMYVAILEGRICCYEPIGGWNCYVYKFPSMIWGMCKDKEYIYVAKAPWASFSILKGCSKIYEGWCEKFGEYGEDISVNGNFAYLVTDKGLTIIDVSDPFSPVVKGNYPAPYWTWGLDVWGDCAFVTDQKYGLRIIDASDPTKPKEIGYYNTPGQAEDVCFSYPYAYIADGWQGLEILECYKLGIKEPLEKNSAPSLYLLPNPSTNIARVYYTLPEPSFITLCLYDCSGRRVEVLDKGYKPTGFYSISFDSKRFPKGVYFLSLKLKDRISTLKIILN